MRPNKQTLALLPILLLAAAQGASAQATPEEIVRGELQLFQGNWTIVSAFMNGNPDDQRFGTRVAVAGNVLQSSNGPNAGPSARLRLQPTLIPKAIDIIWLDGPFRGETFYGIYRFDGPRLYVCATRTGVTRPKQFESRPDKVESLVTFERIP
ncbi:MAG TPA: TIGR03067 domain-containing protein [Pirellulales bacterium]|jgi:uncharacterized protein (TIGR03067 family)|nr:TIGR03067 domain-containing protein [Pirellulales bacterium]